MALNSVFHRPAARKFPGAPRCHPLKVGFMKALSLLEKPKERGAQPPAAHCGASRVRLINRPGELPIRLARVLHRPIHFFKLHSRPAVDIAALGHHYR